jgi:pyruvate-ferredoxin/flavodoxin oxidoreductase
MIMANASGCSTVWGGTAGTSPWARDEKNRGPSWSRSLFEDAAEFGFG